MKISLILTAFFLFQSSAEATIHLPRFEDGKATVSLNGAGPHGWGESIIIDKTGKRLRPTKEEINKIRFNEPGAYTRFVEPGKRGYGLKETKTGKVLVEPTWYQLQQEAMDLEGKHCVVAKKIVVNRRAKGQFGVIDLEGNVVVEPVWDDVYIYTRAKSWLVKKDKKYGLVVPGKVLVEPEWERVAWAQGYSMRFADNGLLTVMKDGKWGYVDESGKVAIDFQFEKASSFKQTDRAIVSVGEDYHLIDRTGKKLVKLPGAPWDEINGMLLDIGPYIPVAKKGKWGCSDLKGKLVIPFEYEHISSPSHWSIFSEGLAPVVKNGKSGYVDEQGKLVIPCKWDLAGDFSEGLAYVERKGHWGFIDKAGKTAIGPTKIKEKEENPQE